MAKQQSLFGASAMRKGNRQAEYLRVSLALSELRNAKVLIRLLSPHDEDKLNKSIEYLEERQVKLG